MKLLAINVGGGGQESRRESVLCYSVENGYLPISFPVRFFPSRGSGFSLY